MELHNMGLPYVSILVMLEVKWKDKKRHAFFASILVSILVMLEVKWKVRINSVVRSPERGFNPCYVGSKMESVEACIMVSRGTLFQSLLCWK